jgi:hypothetical protein
MALSRCTFTNINNVAVMITYPNGRQRIINRNPELVKPSQFMGPGWTPLHLKEYRDVVYYSIPHEVYLTIRNIHTGRPIYYLKCIEDDDDADMIKNYELNDRYIVVLLDNSNIKIFNRRTHIVNHMISDIDSISHHALHISNDEYNYISDEYGGYFIDNIMLYPNDIIAIFIRGDVILYYNIHTREFSREHRFHRA